MGTPPERDYSHLPKAVRKKAEEIERKRREAASKQAQAGRPVSGNGNQSSKPDRSDSQDGQPQRSDNLGILTADEIQSLPKTKLESLVKRYQTDLNILGHAFNDQNQQLSEAKAALKQARDKEHQSLQIRNNQQATFNVTLFTLANQSLRSNYAHSALLNKTVSRVQGITNVPKLQLATERKRLASLGDWALEVNKQMTESFSEDAKASFFQAATVEKSVPFLKNTFVPKSLSRMSDDAEGVLKDADIVLDDVQAAWTDRAGAKDFEFLDPSSISAPDTVTTSATMDQAQYFMAGFVKASDREELANAKESDSSDAASHSGEETSPPDDTLNGRLASREASQKILAAWKGFPKNFTPLDRQGGSRLQGPERAVASKIPEDWFPHWNIPADATSDPPYSGMATAWVCLSSHFRGYYVNAGDKLSCDGCGTSRKRQSESGTRNVKFYLPPKTTVVIPDRDFQLNYYPDVSKADPVKVATDNQKATKAFAKLKVQLTFKNAFHNTPLEERRLKLLELTREKLWPEDIVVTAAPETTKQPQPPLGNYKPAKLHYPDRIRAKYDQELPLEDPDKQTIKFQEDLLLIELGLESARDIDLTEYPVREACAYIRRLDSEFDLADNELLPEHWRYTRQIISACASGMGLAALLDSLSPYVTTLCAEKTRDGIPGSRPISEPDEDSGFLKNPHDLQAKIREAFWLQRSFLRASPLTVNQKRALQDLSYSAIYFCLISDSDAPVEKEPLPPIWYEIAYQVAVDRMLGKPVSRESQKPEAIQKRYYARLETQAPKYRRDVLLSGVAEIALTHDFWDPKDLHGVGPDFPEEFRHLLDNAKPHPHFLKDNNHQKRRAEPEPSNLRPSKRVKVWCPGIGALEVSERNH